MPVSTPRWCFPLVRSELCRLCSPSVPRGPSQFATVSIYKISVCSICKIGSHASDVVLSLLLSSQTYCPSAWRRGGTRLYPYVQFLSKKCHLVLPRYKSGYSTHILDSWPSPVPFSSRNNFLMTSSGNYMILLVATHDDFSPGANTVDESSFYKYCWVFLAAH